MFAMPMLAGVETEPVVRTYSGWVDPDGLANYDNSAQRANSAGTTVVPASSRLYITLPFALNGSFNVVFDLELDAIGHSGSGSVTVELSTNGGTNFGDLAVRTLYANDEIVADQFTVDGSGLAAAGQAVIRLRTEAVLDSGATMGESIEAYLSVAQGGTNPYNVTYDSE